MIATKEQEKQTLKKIKLAIDNLGEESYVGAAFKGCYEMAKDNITNDFLNSMKDLADNARHELEIQKNANKKLQDFYTELEKENATLKELTLTSDDVYATSKLLTYMKKEQMDKAKECAERIVKYATTPQSSEFRDAVTEHTQIMDDLSTIEKTLERMSKIKTYL